MSCGDPSSIQDVCALHNWQLNRLGVNSWPVATHHLASQSRIKARALKRFYASLYLLSYFLAPRKSFLHLAEEFNSCELQAQPPCHLPKLLLTGPEPIAFPPVNSMSDVDKASHVATNEKLIPGIPGIWTFSESIFFFSQDLP